MGFSFAYHGMYKGMAYFQLIANDDFESRFGEQYVFAYSSERNKVIRIHRHCDEMRMLYTFTRDANGNMVYPIASRVSESDKLELLSKLLEANIHLSSLGCIKDVLNL